MDESTSKSLKLGMFILVLFVFAVLVFVWGLVNKGTVVFEGQAPFKVTILEGESIDCDVSPCKIRLVPGEKSFFIEKSDHRNIFVEERVKLWRKTEIFLDFHEIPRLIEAEKVPASEEKFEYSIVTERQTGRQKIVKKNDPQSKAIVYFQRPLKSPEIIGDGKFIIILEEDTAYKIDVEKRTRQELPELELPQIKKQKWSMDGKYWIFEEEGEKIWILDTETGDKKELALSTGINLTDFFYGNTLVFLTNQNHRTTSGSDSEGNVYIEFLDDINTEEYTIGFYYPDTDKYSKLEIREKIKNRPEEIMALGNGKELYLKIDGKDFKIILRKF
jgi:hypothetical protein